MNIEELSKSQLLLLTILVNFVTSIATGILTVSLLDHAPSVVTQTVNRVVERTIETVAQAAPAIVATPAPSLQDQITAAFSADQARTVLIYVAATGTSTPASATGTFLPRSRVVATAATDALPKEALIVFANGAALPASLARGGQGIGIYGFADSAALPSVPATSLVESKTLKLGQSVLALTEDGSAVSGIVSRVASANIRTTLPTSATGAAALDTSGNLVGILSGEASGTLISADVVYALLTATSSALAGSPASS